MARPARPERSRSARSSRQLSRFYHSINLDRVFGTHRERGSLLKFSPRGLTRANHDRLIEKPVRYPNWQGVEDDFQRRGVRHMVATLTVDKFGLDSEVFSFVKRSILHAVCTQRLAVPSPAFHGNQCPLNGLIYMSGTSPFPQTKWDAIFMSMASP